MNARIELEPDWEDITTIEPTGGRSRPFVVALLTRALLLSVPRHVAEERLGLGADHGRWSSEVYRALAAREAERLELRRFEATQNTSTSTECLGSLVLAIRQTCSVEGPLDKLRLAVLLDAVARQMRLPDHVLIELILQEVDVAVYRSLCGS